MEHKHKDALVVELADIDPGTGFEYEAELPLGTLFGEGDGVTPLGDLKVDVTFTRHENDVYLNGRATGAFRYQCGRCLAEYDEPMEVELQTAFFPAGKNEEDEESYTYQGEYIVLDGFLREQFLLAQPLKELCGEDCKGLCPKCGQNLNQSDCGCDTKEVDERLAVLKKLKRK